MDDVCIVGAGPAGLNAALILGRCGRSVVVFDSGQPRNAASQGLHNYLTRDGINPLELRALGRQEVATHPSVRFIDAQVAAIQRHEEGYDIVTVDGRRARARILLLATGRADVLPVQPGFREFYGRGVYHCPYCDAWENRGRKLIAFGEGDCAIDLALALLTWSKDVTLCTPRPTELSPRDRGRLEVNGIGIARAAIVSLGGRDGRLTEARLQNGTTLACDALFFTSALPQKSPLAQSLGCQLDESASVVCTQHAATGVPGLYVAGNVRGGVHLAIMAAAEGAEAAIAINEELAERELKRPPDGGPARETSMAERARTGT